jgi:hypothetical protein
LRFANHLTSGSRFNHVQGKIKNKFLKNFNLLILTKQFQQFLVVSCLVVAVAHGSSGAAAKKITERSDYDTESIPGQFPMISPFLNFSFN